MELRMSVAERIRLDAMARVKRGDLSVVEAAELMSLSLRQARRAWKRFKSQGDGRLVHQLRGRASFGSLVQMDGSHHDWFEGRSDKCVLMVMIDDATNQTQARLYPAGFSPILAVRASILAGFNSGDWLGAGINSTEAAASVGGSTQLGMGYAEAVSLTWAWRRSAPRAC